jgi:phosphoribosylaminoimidazolecarboxamide formyltransferase/IMP cyclohydrolase
MRKIALLSVFDKTGITEVANALVELGYTLLSSGGTAKCLIDAGFEPMQVADLLGGGPILGHRVVTLSRQVHAGLLARDCDIEELEKLGIPRIDFVYVGLFPTAAEAAKPDATYDSINEMIDIGGPTMLKSAAKGERIVVGDPADIWDTITWMREGEADRIKYVRKRAIRIFRQVGIYYLHAADYLEESLA